MIYSINKDNPTSRDDNDIKCVVICERLRSISSVLTNVNVLAADVRTQNVTEKKVGHVCPIKKKKYISD